ncbi:hypothetical protein ACE1ET_01550 [Saccharicrinis sp. FJH62]|uniref:hypothetical protein n=1 Tax=Saccharicrinis sp. FJH62 TaxID=3344657 RepID=UPI0035D51BA7
MNELKITALYVILLSIISCTGKQNSKNEVQQINDSTTIIKNDIPVAFEDEGFIAEAKSFSRFGKYNSNIIDKLFEDYLKNDEELDQMIQTFQSLQTEYEKPEALINAYMSNNNDYYQAVLNMLEFVRDEDTVICDLVLKKVYNSKKNFEKQRDRFKNLQDEKKQLLESWDTYLTVVKALKTLEMVEKYQKTESVDPKSFIKIMNEQKEQIKQIKSQVK